MREAKISATPLICGEVAHGYELNPKPTWLVQISNAIKLCDLE
jgi:hypothetical protein